MTCKTMRRTTIFIAGIVLLPLAVGCRTDTDPPPEAPGGAAPVITASRPASAGANTPATSGKAAGGVELGTTDERMAELVAYLKKKGFPLTQGDRRGMRYRCVIDKTADGCEAFTTFVVLPSDSNDRDNQRRYAPGGL